MCGNCLFSDSFEILLDFPVVALDFGTVLLKHPCRITAVSLVLIAEGLKSGTCYKNSAGISGNLWLSQCQLLQNF